MNMGPSNYPFNETYATLIPAVAPDGSGSLAAVTPPEADFASRCQNPLDA